jgi:hypothetical protein
MDSEFLFAYPRDCRTSSYIWRVRQVTGVPTWTEGSCVEGDFPDQHGLVEALPMHGALHFFFQIPVG